MARRCIPTPTAPKARNAATSALRDASLAVETSDDSLSRSMGSTWRAMPGEPTRTPSRPFGYRAKTNIREKPGCAHDRSITYTRLVKIRGSTRIHEIRVSTKYAQLAKHEVRRNKNTLHLAADVHFQLFYKNVTCGFDRLEMVHTLIVDS